MFAIPYLAALLALLSEISPLSGIVTCHQISSKFRATSIRDDVVDDFNLDVVLGK